MLVSHYGHCTRHITFHDYKCIKIVGNMWCSLHQYLKHIIIYKRTYLHGNPWSHSSSWHPVLSTFMYMCMNIHTLTFNITSKKERKNERHTHRHTHTHTHMHTHTHTHTHTNTHTNTCTHTYTHYTNTCTHTHTHTHTHINTHINTHTHTQTHTHKHTHTQTHTHIHAAAAESTFAFWTRLSINKRLRNLCLLFTFAVGLLSSCKISSFAFFSSRSLVDCMDSKL